MWPWGHAAVGYLLYTSLVRLRRGHPPDGLAVLALALGTQLPDLVDKPLAWTVTVLPTGRSLAHSLFTVGVVVSVCWWIVDRDHRQYVTALGVGWVTHGFADVAGSVAAGEFAYANFLLWPVLQTPPYDAEQSFVAHVVGVDATPYFLLQGVLTVVAVLVWWWDGYPGWETIRSRVL